MHKTLWWYLDIHNERPLRCSSILPLRIKRKSRSFGVCLLLDTLLLNLIPWIIVSNRKWKNWNRRNFEKKRELRYYDGEGMGHNERTTAFWGKVAQGSRRVNLGQTSHFMSQISPVTLSDRSFRISQRNTTLTLRTEVLGIRADEMQDP